MGGDGDSGVVPDGGLVRRLKALACTAPLNDLDSRKSRLEWVDSSIYQMAEIGLHVIDQVTIAMDFDAGADAEQIIARTVPLVAMQGPARSHEEHCRVAQWVLDSLINVGTVDRGFQRVYGEVDDAGIYVRRRFDFKLLIELSGAGGEIYLRATDEAINVLVGALDTDIESAQVAAEVKLDNLIRRGRLADAKLAAEQARYRTVQLGEALRTALEATRRDVRAVDWDEAVPALLDSALDHVHDRFTNENAILRHIADARDEAIDPRHKRQAAELVTIVEDCMRRHSQLLMRLQRARALFRAEQDRQLFADPPRREAADLHGQLLRPIMGLPAADARDPLEAYFRSSAGLARPSVVTLSSLVDLLLRVPPEQGNLGRQLPEPELVPVTSTDRFSDEHWQMVSLLLDLQETTRPLSELLVEAAELDEDLPALVSLLATHAYAPELGSAMRRGQQHVLLALPTGDALPLAGVGGVHGDDLLLTAVALLDDEASR
ncbi:hypothetical protein ACFUYE_00165 [Micromonospora humida]|uniref:hypothetical protein n=1 Tax=Micromonospora humida TaxID=2809018 RepID=UPI003671FFF6